MTFSKLEMYSMLSEYANIPEESIDLVVKILGDTPQTYVKILKAGTNFSSFIELEDYANSGKWAE